VQRTGGRCRGAERINTEADPTTSKTNPIQPTPTAVRIRSKDPKEKQRRLLGDIIYAYSKRREGILCLYWGLDWRSEEKQWILSHDKLHLSEIGYKELGRQVRGDYLGGGGAE